MADRDESPEALAHALVQRIFELLHDCRATLPKLEVPVSRSESASAQAERLLYLALLGALEAGLVRTMEDVVTVLRQASRPAGADGGGVAQSPGAAPESSEAGGRRLRPLLASSARRVSKPSNHRANGRCSSALGGRRVRDFGNGSRGDLSRQVGEGVRVCGGCENSVRESSTAGRSGGCAICPRDGARGVQGVVVEGAGPLI
jgi:hypothetical protein